MSLSDIITSLTLDDETKDKICNCLDHVNSDTTIESVVDVNQYIYELFKNTTDHDDLNLSIFNFFNKYPTKKTYRCPDGTIINMSPYEPAVDINLDKLPLKDGIPQGEEATRMILRNVDSGVIISSPPGVPHTYFITRYGSPVSINKSIRYDDYKIKRFNELKNHFMININPVKECFFNKFKCDNSKVRKILAPDFDIDNHCCDKHRTMTGHLVNINVASINDLKLFISDEYILKYGMTNKLEKSKLLKKVKIVLDLAESRKLLNRNLDPEFILYGIHFYPYWVDKQITHGWALLYHNSSNKIAHIYMNEVTDDIEIIKTIEMFAFQIINAKHYNDLVHIETYLRHQKKPQFTQMEKVFKKPYILDVKGILNNSMLY
jgi:hypothetical protein